MSEGSGENMFVVRDGKILTPPLGASVLPGITRDTVIQLAQSLGIPVVETLIPREMLYIADEVFFSGTAAEITPIRSVDRITIGKGTRGPITEKLQREFFGIVEGRAPGSLRLADTGGAAGWGPLRSDCIASKVPREPDSTATSPETDTRPVPRRNLIQLYQDARLPSRTSSRISTALSLSIPLQLAAPHCEKSV